MRDRDERGGRYGRPRGEEQRETRRRSAYERDRRDEPHRAGFNSPDWADVSRWDYERDRYGDEEAWRRSRVRHDDQTGGMPWERYGRSLDEMADEVRARWEPERRFRRPPQEPWDTGGLNYGGRRYMSYEPGREEANPDRYDRDIEREARSRQPPVEEYRGRTFAPGYEGRPSREDYERRYGAERGRYPRGGEDREEESEREGFGYRRRR